MAKLRKVVAQVRTHQENIGSSYAEMQYHLKMLNMERLEAILNEDELNFLFQQDPLIQKLLSELQIVDVKSFDELKFKLKSLENDSDNHQNVLNRLESVTQKLALSGVKQKLMSGNTKMSMNTLDDHYQDKIIKKMQLLQAELDSTGESMANVQHNLQQAQWYLEHQQALQESLQIL